MCKTEDKKGKAAPEPNKKSDFDAAAGRGVYTSGSWRKAVSYSPPTAAPGSEALD